MPHAPPHPVAAGAASVSEAPASCSTPPALRLQVLHQCLRRLDALLFHHLLTLPATGEGHTEGRGKESRCFGGCGPQRSFLACQLSAAPPPPSPWLSSTLFACHVAQVGYTNRNAQGTIGPFPWRYVGLAQPDTPDPTNVTNKREIFK